jgi:hypothetical protein
MLDQPWLVEVLGLLDEDLSDEVGVIQLVDVQRTDLIVSDIAEPPCDIQAERQRIERKDPRQHRPMTARTGSM